MEASGDDLVFAGLKHPDAYDDGVAAAGQAGAGGASSCGWIEFDARSAFAHFLHHLGCGDLDAIQIKGN